MRIGILSDTHNQFERTRRAIEMLLSQGIEVLFHCGDFTDPEILHLCSAKPCYFVFGNNDDAATLHKAASETEAVCLKWGGEVTLAGGQRIAIAHGHQPKEFRQLLTAGPDYLLSGHSHEVEDRREGATRCINPGALHRAARYTVGVLDLDADDLQILEVDRKKPRA